MNKLIELLIIGLFLAVKLIVTGICLAIGFSIGGIIMNKTKTKIAKHKQTKMNKEEPITVAV